MFGYIHVIIRRHACKLNTRSQRETYITDGKHASLGICVQGNTHPWETHITVTPVFLFVVAKKSVWLRETRPNPARTASYKAFMCQTLALQCAQQVSIPC